VIAIHQQNSPEMIDVAGCTSQPKIPMKKMKKMRLGEFAIHQRLTDDLNP
jgi:hypothetical protein